MSTGTVNGKIVNRKSLLGRLKDQMSQRNTLVALLFGVIVMLLTASLAYNNGYDKGYESGNVAGVESGKKEAQAAPFSNVLNTASNPFNSVTGTVKDIKKDRIIVETENEGEKNIKINDSTLVTINADRLNIDDINDGQKVTVFTNNPEYELATRIVLR